MNKGILIKAGLILGFFGIALGLAFGCSAVKDNDVTPSITNPEGVYLTVGDITVTRQELWENLLLANGTTYLEEYSERLLLKTYIDNVEPPEVDEAIEYMKFGTNDPDEIAELMADTEEYDALMKSYEQNLFVLGYDPENAADLKAFVELNIAKENATRDYILDLEEGDSLYLSDEDKETYYNNSTKGDICVLDIRFNSEDEANDVLDYFDLVPNYEGGWGKYNGTEDITSIANSGFDATNTTELTDEDVFLEFVGLYNYMNPNNLIATDITYENYCADHADIAVRNFDDILDGKEYTDTAVTYATYIFDTLGVEEDDTRYSISLQEAGAFQMLSFKVSEESITDYAGLTDTEKDEIVNEILDEIVTTTSMDIMLEELWLDNKLEVFEPTLKLKYEQSDGTKFDNKGSETLVATVGDNEITADMLFDYMADSLGSYFVIDLVQEKYLLNSPFYTSRFGESHDYINSNNELLVGYREDLRTMKGMFSADNYAGYGFSSADYTWTEFLLLAFGTTGESDFMESMYVLPDLKPYLTGATVDYSEAAAYVQDMVDGYFSLNAERVLVYLDKDQDFLEDDFNEFVAGLDVAGLAEYNALLVALENTINSHVSDGETFAEIVTAYNDALVGETNDWAQFKAYGFYISTETFAAVSYSDTTKEAVEEEIYSAFKRIYDEYVAAVDSSIDDITEYYDDELIQTVEGLSLIKSTEGAGFVQPSAVYDNTEGNYSEGSGGLTVAPSADQVALYMQIEWSDLTEQVAGVLLPDSVITAIEAYYGEVYAVYYSTAGYSIAATEYLLANNPQFSVDNAGKISYLEGVLEILIDINFPEGVVIAD